MFYIASVLLYVVILSAMCFCIYFGHVVFASFVLLLAFSISMKSINNTDRKQNQENSK